MKSELSDTERMAGIAAEALRRDQRPSTEHDALHWIEWVGEEMDNAAGVIDADPDMTREQTIKDVRESAVKSIAVLIAFVATLDKDA